MFPNSLRWNAFAAAGSVAAAGCCCPPGSPCVSCTLGYFKLRDVPEVVTLCILAERALGRVVVEKMVREAHEGEISAW
jgi:hypothetical protein